MPHFTESPAVRRSVSEWVAGELGRTSPLSLTETSAVFAPVTQRLRHGEDDGPVGIVNSFLYADLNHVVDAVRGWGPREGCVGGVPEAA